MNASPFYRKRELSPLQRARVSLGLDVGAKPKTNFAWLLRKVGLSATGIEYLRFSDDVQAQKVVAKYDSLNRTERRASTIDYLILAAGVDPHHVWGALQGELSRLTDARATLLACMCAQTVIEVAVKNALTPKGHADRKLILATAMRVS